MDIVIYIKRQKQEEITAFELFVIGAMKATPPFFLKTVTLGGITYKVPWYLYRQRCRLYMFTWVAWSATRKGTSKRYKMANLMLDLVYDKVLLKKSFLNTLKLV